MEKLITHILKNITDHPDEVSVTIAEAPDQITVNLTVHPDDAPKVIGKGGRTINAIRQIAKILSLKQNKKLLLKLD